MAIIATVSFSKKIPVPDSEYSSQGYSLALQTEIPDTDPAAIRARLHNTFELVKSSVEQELANGNGQTARPAESGSKANGRPSGSADRASNKQCKYIADLGRNAGMSLSDLNAYVRETYRADTIYDLSRTDASKVVDWLKSKQRKAA